MVQCKTKRLASRINQAQPEQDQREGSGRCLHIKYPRLTVHGTVNTGDDHAEQEEHLDLECKGRRRWSRPQNRPAARKPL